MSTELLSVDAQVYFDIAVEYEERATKAEQEVMRLRPVLMEAERFMAYFAGETGGSFVGPGTPQSCLAQIRAALTPADGGGK
jgi:flagellar basal body-associated protein FliL